MPKRSCERCEYVAKWDKPSGMGECRFHPPLVIPAREAYLDDAGHSAKEDWTWPAVDRYDWCGKFKSAG